MNIVRKQSMLKVCGRIALFMIIACAATGVVVAKSLISNVNDVVEKMAHDVEVILERADSSLDSIEALLSTWGAKSQMTKELASALAALQTCCQDTYLELSETKTGVTLLSQDLLETRSGIGVSTEANIIDASTMTKEQLEALPASIFDLLKSILWAVSH